MNKLEKIMLSWEDTDKDNKTLDNILENNLKQNEWKY